MPCAIIRPLFTAFLCLALPGMAWAHSVYIFAWVDDGQICTESYFTQRNKVAGGEVIMADATGSPLATGITNPQGLYCFALPDKAQPLQFIILAGAGHRGTFNMRENELAAVIEAMIKLPEATTASVTASAITPQMPQQSATETSATQEPAGTISPSPALAQTASAQPVQTTLNEAQLRAIMQDTVRQELQAQLSPLRQQLAEQQGDTIPSVREIVGGMGWLLGLGALGFWWSERKGKQQ